MHTNAQTHVRIAHKSNFGAICSSAACPLYTNTALLSVGVQTQDKVYHLNEDDAADM